MIDHGEYSDHHVEGFFVVLKEMNPSELLDEFMSTRPEQLPRYKFDEHGFLAMLATSGYILDIKYHNLFLGGYSDHEDVELYTIGSDE